MNKFEQWIEWMEGETGPEQTGDLNMLLKHSLDDQKILDNLRRLRLAVKEAHESSAVDKLLKDKNYLERLHAQILRGVKRRPGRPSLQVVSQRETSSDRQLDL